MPRNLAAPIEAIAQDAVEHGVPPRMVRVGTMPAHGITDRLRYANPSAFTRAFNRWAGRAPTERRAPRRAVSCA